MIDDLAYNICSITYLYVLGLVELNGAQEGGDCCYFTPRDANGRENL